MSRTPQTLANATKGAEIKRLGFKTSIHRYEDIRVFVNTQLNEGRTVSYIYAEGVNKFGKERMPSKQALSSYRDKHWVAGNDSVSLHFDYAQALKNYDAYRQLVELAQVHWARYEMYVEREQTTKIPNQLIQRELLMYKDVLTKIIDIEIRIGVRQGTVAPTLNLTDNSINNTINVDKETLNESIDTLEELIKLQSRLNTYRTPDGSSDSGDTTEGEIVSKPVDDGVHREDSGSQEQSTS